MPGELEQQLVARDQQVGFTARGENQELLVVGVAATRKWIVFLALARTDNHEFAVASHQRRSRIVIEAELGITGNASEFGKAIIIGKTDEPLRCDRCLQRLRMDIGKVQHVHHDVRVEDQPGCCGKRLHWVF